MNQQGDNCFIFDVVNSLVEQGYKLSKSIQAELLPEAKQYHGAIFSLNGKKCVYRKGKVTADRPGAFLALWKRPNLVSGSNKPIPLIEEDIDYLFIKVEEHYTVNQEGSVVAQDHLLIDKPKVGLFIFPVKLLLEKGFIASVKYKGKTGFRVFPPWSGNRGNHATKVFSESGKKTQAWQLPYFVEIDENGALDISTFNQITKCFS